MRVNIYAEELTQRLEFIQKQDFFGLRIYLELPVTKEVNGGHVITKGATKELDGEKKDISSCVTFWAKSKIDLEDIFRQARLHVVHEIEEKNG